MVDRPEVDSATIAALRTACAGLPEAYEEAAWVGTRWRIRTRTFAHVVVIADGHPPAYARAAGTDGPVTVLTFRAAGPELAALSAAGPPFFAPVWFGDMVGLVLDETTDWDEVRELLVESYCKLAPKKLAEQVPRPAG
jgi:hypothetical protein